MATYVLTIAGVTKTLRRGSLRISETTNGRNTLSLDVVSTDGSYRPALNAEVILTENGTRVFGGNITTPLEEGIRPEGGTGIVTHISAADFNALADRRHVTTTIPTGTLKAALQVLDDYLTPYGVTLDAGQANGPTLPELVYDGRLLSEVFDELSTLTTFVWEIDYNKTLRMFQPGTVAAPFNVVPASDDNAIGDISVEPSRLEYANRIIVLAGTGQREVTISAAGNGTQTSFPLTYQFAFDRGYVTNDGIFETIGPFGATWSYNASTNSIERISPVANGNVVVFTFTAQFPYRAQVDNTSEQSSNGIWERQFVLPDVFDAQVAFDLATALLDRHITIFKTVKYRTLQTGIRPGQTQTITVPARDISGTHLVTDVETSETGAKVPTTMRMVTAVSGTQYPGSWRDTWRSLNSSGGSSTSASTITLVQLSGVQFGGGSVTLTDASTSKSWQVVADPITGGGSKPALVFRDIDTSTTTLNTIHLLQTGGTTVPEYTLRGASSVLLQLGANTGGQRIYQLHVGSTATFLDGLFERGRSSRIGEWAEYFPSLTNVTLGNGTLVGRVAKVGKTVHFTVILVAGSTTSVSGLITVSTPSSFSADATSKEIAIGTSLNPSNGALWPMRCLIASGSTIAVYTSTAPMAPTSGTSPFTWTTDAQLWVHGTYEES